MTTIFDTHCHYNMDPLWSEWQAHWQKSQEFGVDRSLIIGVDLESSRRGVEIAEQDERLYAAVGLHPTDIDDSVHEQLDEAMASIKQLIHTSKKVSAIGETGLDYYWLEDDQKPARIARQKETFTAHIHLANEYNLPLIIHARDKGEQAYWDILELVTHHYQFEQPFILHCVSGPMEYVQQAVKLGAYIGMAGNVTYPKAEYLRDLVRSVPTDRLLLETDAPFLPPQQHRGKKCEPWMISETAEFVERELQLDLEKIYQNSYRVLLGMWTVGVIFLLLFLFFFFLRLRGTPSPVCDMISFK